MTKAISVKVIRNVFKTLFHFLYKTIFRTLQLTRYSFLKLGLPSNSLEKTVCVENYLKICIIKMGSLRRTSAKGKTKTMVHFAITTEPARHS